MAKKYGIEVTYIGGSKEKIWHTDKTQRDNVLKSWTPKKILDSKVRAVKPIEG